MGTNAGILGRKRARDIALSFAPNTDIEVSTAVSVVSRFVKEVWMASLVVPFRDTAVISLGQLAEGMKAYPNANTSPPASINGPVSALHNCIDEAGWSFQTPFELVTERGDYIRATRVFKKDLADALTARGALRLHDAVGTAESAALVSQGVFFAPLRSLYNSMNYVDKQTLISIASDGIFTNTDLHMMGYIVDPECQSCHAALDTVFHRCFSCPHVSPNARIFLGERLFDAIIDAGEDSLYATRCLTPIPDCTSTPSAATMFKCMNFQADDVFRPEDGEVFGDGSCFFSNCSNSNLSRAGFAVGQFTPDGEVVKAIYGCLPKYFPQNSPAAEYIAFATFLDNSETGSYVGDCAEVINRFHGGIGRALAVKSPFACVWKTLLMRHGPHFASRVSVSKTKAHRSIDEIVDETDRARFFGNQAVDLLAKEGALLHAPPDGEVALYKAKRQELKTLARHMVDVLRSLRLDRVETRIKLSRIPVGLPGPRQPDCDKVKHKHIFIWKGKCWMCSVCLKRTRVPLSHQSCKSCPGPPPFAGLLKDSKGHTLWSAALEGGGVVLYCSKCYHYASPHPRRLRGSCSQVPDVFKPSEEFYLRKLVHPVSRLRMLRPIRMNDQPNGDT